jgi:cytidine deaminase
MVTHKLTVAYTEYTSAEMLPAEDKQLLTEAVEACNSAYAPYSKFHVGAAVKLANNKVFKGNNQENAAYPSGICAERVAVFSASAAQPGIAIQSIAVVAQTDSFEIISPVTPCGACRQVLAEYENLSGKPLRIILQAGNGRVWILNGIDNLLPLRFQGENLKKK